MTLKRLMDEEVEGKGGGKKVDWILWFPISQHSCKQSIPKLTSCLQVVKESAI